MTITALREELRDALSIAERFSGKQLSLPVVGNVLLKAESQKLRIQSTNLETGLEIVIPAKVTKEGSVTVPPRILLSLLQTLPDLAINLEERKNSVVVETDSSKTEIRGISASEFPIMPTIKAKSTLSVPNQAFIRQLTRVIPAISQSDFKPEISGMLLKTEKKHLVLVGTDTFRLVEARIEDYKVSDEISVIIPIRALQELLRLTDPEGETAFKISGEQVMIETGPVRMITRLMSGRYPEYQALIPKDFSATVRVARGEVMASVRLASAFASKLHDVILHYRPGHFAVEIVNPETGNHQREIKASVSGKAGKVAFNHRYLSDAIEAPDAPEVVLHITDETRPALIRDEVDSSFFTILMPLRVS
ncbi:MAG: DNA polymerase III subunit beta [Candidatus Sungbacteria bacterium]|nr:DNA polymerase III subunit beta [Candidatus Sungbacteria bacterium]